MDMLQVHAAALKRVSAAHHECLLRYKACANIVYGIVEGKEDPMFYRGLIEFHLPEGWEIELIPAGCKDEVFRAFEAFDWTQFSPKRICFFVDRDLSVFIPEIVVSAENIYVTDNYSIENDTVNFGVFKRLLIEVLNIGNLNPTESEAIEHRFSAALAFFQEAMVPVMAQILLWQRNGKKPCLNNIDLKDFFIFADGNIKLRNEFGSIFSRLQHAGRCLSLQASELTELSTVEAEFRNGQGTERFVRGKYQLWFLIEFALEIHRSISLLVGRIKVAPKVRISIGPKNAMVVLAPRARCPSSLQRFLERTYQLYISEHINSQNPVDNIPVGVTAY